ncbi:DUF3048 domain-containing protein [Candidatus Uhrbacteria bacterium]|nr:DUF3048 domain-containing protein [Candidatus Uhrbacteria bacterium]
MKKEVLEIVKRMRPKWAFLLVLGVVMAAAVSWWNIREWRAGLVRPSSETVTEEKQGLKRRRIDGVEIAKETLEAYPLAVVVENSIDGRPLSGMARANLVWEAPVEAGITRLLAVYADAGEVPKIGPVRSARPYFVDWAEETRALFAHVGGSAEALSLIPRSGLKDLNEFWHGQYFWRSRQRFAPHNTYTSTALLAQALADRQLDEPPLYQSWKFKDDAPEDQRGKVVAIAVPFSGNHYQVGWEYDRAQNVYDRFQDGALIRDADDNSPVRVKNVVVMETDISIIDNEGRRRVRTLGSGRARLFRDGQMLAGTWKREDREARTTFWDDQGNEMVLNAGTSWIEVIGEMDEMILSSEEN